jgi:hypothetical protein
MASCAPSTTLCAGAGSFGAALLEAAAQALVEARPVLLIAYDLPYPEPLRALWTLADPFAVAMLLAQPDTDAAGPRVRIELTSAPPGDDWPDALPRELARNPAAAALPLLAILARRGDGHLVVPYLDHCSIELEVTA